MEESDRLSTTALVVALIALLISLLQLLQQFFSTADGYRRCKEPALGYWERLTRTPFHWKEFRYETIYSVPEIELASRSTDLGVNEIIYRVTRSPSDSNQQSLSLFVLEGSKGGTQQRALGSVSLSQSLDQHGADADTKKTQDEERGLHSLPPAVSQSPGHIPGFRNKSIRSRYSQYVDSAFAATLQHDSRLETSRTRTSPKSHATWLAFLRMMYDRTAVSSSLPVTDMSFSTGTDALVRVSEHSWDFTPDIRRPRASSTVSTVVILGVRMGMEWDRLGGGQSGMEAFGHGIALTSTSDPSGRVLQFILDGTSTHKPPKIAPTKISDKMICGIIPPALGGSVIKLVADSGAMDQCEALASALDLSDKARECLEAALKPKRIMRKTVANDLMTFLLPLATIAGIDAFEVKFPAWFGYHNNDRHSAFHSAFYETLYDRLQSPNTGGGRRIIKDMVEGLRAFRKDSRPGWDWKTVDSVGNGAERSSFLQHLHELHGKTTRWLKNFGFFNVCLLLDAYIVTAVNVKDTAKETEQSEPEEISNVPPKSKWRRGPVSRKQLNLLKAYMEQNFIEELKKHMRDSGELQLSDQNKIETAWWVLLVRGMLWDMSCRCLPPGKPIPSSTYYNSTRVWIE